MLDLVATGPESGQRWRRQVPSGVVIRLGRTPQDGWDVAWDMRVSREHANLTLDGNKLQIHCLKTATNPVYYQGEPFREVVVKSGDDFRIGETTFRLEEVPAEIAARVAPHEDSPAEPAANETLVVSELEASDAADLEAALARTEAEAHQASELAEQRSLEIQELHGEIQALNQELKKATSHADSLESKLSKLEVEHQSARDSLREAATRIQREKSAVAGLNAEREHLKAEIDSLKSRIISGEKLLSTAREAAGRNSNEANQRESEVAALQAAVASLRKHLEDKNNDLHAAQSTVRQKTDDAGKLNAVIESLKIDIDALNEQIQNREVSLEIIRLENKEKSEEARQLRRLNEGLQDEVESLRGQVQSHTATLRKNEVQTQHEAREAQRFREQNEALIDEIRSLKRKLEGSSLSQIDSINLTREPRTEETVDEKLACPTASAELKQFGQYRILEKIGQGGMGVVYKAVHTRLDKVVALKLLTEGRLRTPENIARFDREMKAIGRLDHGNLVRAHDAGETGDALYLVMEFVDGMDVTDLLRFAGTIPLPDVCEIIHQAATGMEYVHRRKLVHRDLKPSNLMLTRTGHVKILDLGLAQLNDWGGVGLTQSGQIMGTLEYMAPEQAGDSRLVDFRADIYSLGCTLFEMLAGRSPYNQRGNESLAELILAHATRPLPPLTSVRPDVPADLETLVNQMTAKAPADRPPSMQEIARRLKPFCGSASLSALLTTVTASGRHDSTTSWNRGALTSNEKDDTSQTCSAELGTRSDTPEDAGPEPATPQPQNQPVAEEK